jgi:hypothetical protein
MMKRQVLGSPPAAPASREQIRNLLGLKLAVMKKTIVLGLRLWPSFLRSGIREAMKN